MYCGQSWCFLNKPRIQAEGSCLCYLSWPSLCFIAWLIGFLDLLREQALNVGPAYPFTWHRHISEEIRIYGLYHQWRGKKIKISNYIIPYYVIGIYVDQPGSFIRPKSNNAHTTSTFIVQINMSWSHISTLCRQSSTSQTFWLCAAHTFVHYKFSSLIHLLYAKFGLACTADKQIFQAITQCHYLLTEPMLQPLHLLHNIISCVCTVVFICFCKNFFQTAYPTIPTCSRSSNKNCSTYPPTHAPAIMLVSTAVTPSRL